jgi:hypothetical protein
LFLLLAIRYNLKVFSPGGYNAVPASSKKAPKNRTVADTPVFQDDVLPV